MIQIRLTGGRKFKLKEKKVWVKNNLRHRGVSGVVMGCMPLALFCHIM